MPHGFVFPNSLAVPTTASRVLQAPAAKFERDLTFPTGRVHVTGLCTTS